MKSRFASLLKKISVLALIGCRFQSYQEFLCGIPVVSHTNAIGLQVR